jgi:hypothetical protein
VEASAPAPPRVGRALLRIARGEGAEEGGSWSSGAGKR